MVSLLKRNLLSHPGEFVSTIWTLTMARVICWAMVSQENPSCQRKTEHDGKIRTGDQWTNGALRTKGMDVVVLVFN
jgi:hypothetical protein